ncbi:MAG: hypothetical protein J6J17_04845 [Bacilli bacterium]|nr:hypothetical protein [Bacilli bacterium]
MDNGKTNKGLIATIIILIIMVLCLIGYIVCDKFILSTNKDDKVKVNEKIQNNEKKVKEPLKDFDESKSDSNEISEKNNYIGNSTLTEEDVKKIIILSYFHSIYGYNLADYKIDKLSLDYNTTEYKKIYEYNEDDILFSVIYSVKPSDTNSYEQWSAGNGTDGSGGWLIQKTAVGVIRKDNNGYYYLHSIGTGW